MQWDGTAAVAVASHGVAVLAFGALVAFCRRRGDRRAMPADGIASDVGRMAVKPLATAALATALWAACVMAAVLNGAAPEPPRSPSLSLWLLDLPEALRAACWLAVLLRLAGAGARWLVGGLMLPLAGLLLAAVTDAPPLLQAALPLATAVLGMLLVEHVYRAAPLNARWGIKFACLGIGALFTYDFYFYSDAMLFRRLHPDIWAARGMVNALSAPLLAMAVTRNPAWTPHLQLSRQIMFHSAALLGSALYLLAMAASAWYLRTVGGAWGTLMQAACLCGAALLLAAVLFSGTTRARLKLFISKHFYKAHYLTHKAVMLGYHPEVILAGRRINDSMAKFVAEKTVKEMVRAGFKLKGCHVNVLGLTFKENCPDLRNSKVAELILELQSYGLQVHVHDPVADAEEALHEYGVKLEAWEDLPCAEALISAVAHRELSPLPLRQILDKLAPGGCFVDLKSQFDPAALRGSGRTVWRL